MKCKSKLVRGEMGEVERGRRGREEGGGGRKEGGGGKKGGGRKEGGERGEERRGVRKKPHK